MKLRPRSELREQQHIIASEIKNNDFRLIVSAMGSGKTGATLDALVTLFAEKKIRRVLIIAPKRVARSTWPDEIRTWAHTQHLTFAVAVNDDAALREAALRKKAQITIINRDNLQWLAKLLRDPANWPYDCVIVDESSMFKAGQMRTKKTTTKTVKTKKTKIEYGPAYDFSKNGELLKAVRISSAGRRTPVDFTYVAEGVTFDDDVGHLLGWGETLDLTFQKVRVNTGGNTTRFGVLALSRPFIKRIYLLTGTPAPNGPGDLWGQVYLLDQGKRLGVSKHQFDRRYYEINPYTRARTIYDDSEEIIMSKIKDVMVALPPLELVPPPVYIPVKVKLSDETLAEYKRFQKTLISQVHDVEAVNSGVLTNKLLQFANGSMYREDKSISKVHEAKFEALDELIEEANGEPVLIWYGFKFDLDEIRKRYPHAVVFNEDDDSIEKWNRGEIKIGLAHPASLGHGINLQYGGHIAIWFGLTWSLELYQQANARLPRPGQKHIVAIYQIIAEGTADERVVDVLDGKASTQDSVTNAVLYCITGEEDDLESLLA